MDEVFYKDYIRLRKKRVSFATAVVVKHDVPISGKSGDKAIIKNDGSFKFNGKISQGTEVWLNANDSSGLITDMKVEIEVLSASKKFINNKKYYALIIGNNDYERWDDLVSPINDTNEIAKVLKEKYKFKVTLLHNAKKDEMENALWDLSEKITEDDYLLIYYAGHGSKDVAIQKAYWIPTDAKAIDKPGRYWLSTSIVTEHVGRIKARHVLLMVDSCYSGITVKGENNIEADVEILDEDSPSTLFSPPTSIISIISSSEQDIKKTELIKRKKNKFFIEQIYHLFFTQ